MDISGRIEAVLRGMVEQRPRMSVEMETILSRSAVGFHEESGFYVPGCRDVYRYLGLTATLREVPRDDADPKLKYFQHMAADLASVAAELLRRSEPAPVDLLWHHWVLTISWRRKNWKLDRTLLKALWERAFSEQSAEGYLHPLTSETAMDSFVYDELCAIHAAYRSALVIGDAGMMQRVRRMVEWHVGNTQPDHTTAEPWGLAAFAALDETGTFAEQQLHDCVAGVQGKAGLIVMGLLADALLAMRDAEGMRR